MNFPDDGLVRQVTAPARRWSVRTLLTRLVLACLLPGILGAGILLIYQVRQSHLQLELDRIQTARALVQNVDSYLLRVRVMAEALATEESLAQGDFHHFRQRAREVLARTGIGSNALLIDESAQQILNLRQLPGQTLPKSPNTQAIRRIFATGKPEVSDLMPGPLVQRPVTAVYVPVFLQEKVAYILAIGIQPEEFNHILTTQSLPADWVVAIFDTSGTTVARSHAPERFVGQSGNPELIRRIKTSPEGIAKTTTRDGIPVYAIFSRSPTTGWSIAMGIPRDSFNVPLADTLILVGLGVAGLFTIGLGLAWLMGGKIVRSFQALVAPATALGAGGKVVVPRVEVEEAAEVTQALAETASLLLSKEMELAERGKALRRSEARLQIFTEYSPAAIAVFDREMRYQAVSQRWLEDFGLVDRDPIGLCHYDLIPNLPAKWKEAHRRGLAGEAVHSEADRFVRADGSVQWLHWHLWPWRDDSGALGGIVIASEDVTARVQAEEQLRISEEHYRTLFSNMSEAFLLGEPVFDDQGQPVDFRLLEANEAYFMATGLPRTVIGRPAREYTPDLEQSWISACTGVAMVGQAMRFENYNGHTGRYYDIHVFSPSPGRFAVLGRDITRRRHMEKQLQESETYLRQLIATLPGMVWTASSRGAVDFVSQQWVDYTGSSFESQLGSGFLDFIHPEDQEEIREVWQEAVACQTGFHSEYRFRRHDGTYRWFKARATPLLDKDWQLTQWLGVVIDIDDLKQAEVALHESKARFQAVFEQAAVGIALVALDGRWVEVNDGLCSIVGYDREELLRLGFPDITHPPDLEADWSCARRLLAGEAASYSMEKRYVRKEGGLVWVNLTVSLVQTPAGAPEYFLTVIEDIQARKEAEGALDEARQAHLQDLERQVAERTAALQAAHDHLEERVAERTEQVRRLAAELTCAEERERQTLARDLHDDLGQLLHVAKIKVGLLGREKLSDKGVSLVEETGLLIGDASRQVRSLTSQLSPPILTTLGLSAALRWLCGEVQQIYGLSVSCRIDDVSHCGLSQAHSVILFRAARELLINAAKHSGSDRASLDLVQEGRTLIMAVTDYGVGFRRLEEAMAGTRGFGLVSVNERITFLGGIMDIQVPSDGGARVVLRLPLEAITRHGEVRQ